MRLPFLPLARLVAARRPLIDDSPPVHPRFDSGFIAQKLADKFDRVTAVDPSASMVAVGLQPPSSSGKPPIAYHVGSVEDLGHLAPGSVDLVTAGQAAHWFAFPGAWDELARVLAPRGTVAFWVGLPASLLSPCGVFRRLRSSATLTDSFALARPLSRATAVRPGSSCSSARREGGLTELGLVWPVRRPAEMHLPTHPDLSPRITSFMRSSDGIGPYWQQPGRSIVEALLDPIPFPSAADGSQAGVWDPSSFARVKTTTAAADGGRPLAIRKTLTWEGLEAYVRTASALHKYEEAHPPVAGRADVVDDFVRGLRKAVGEVAGDDVGEVEVEWPAVVLLAGKR